MANETYKIIYAFEKKFILHHSGTVQVLTLSELEKEKQLAINEHNKTEITLTDIERDISHTKNPSMWGRILTAVGLRNI